jgi:hypothetical protein
MTNDKEQGLTATPLPAIKLQNKSDKVCSEWVGLTDDEHMKLAEEWGCLSADWVLYAAAVERKLKEKNT